jgi:hypothetical protein
LRFDMIRFIIRDIVIPMLAIVIFVYALGVLLP